MKYISLFSGIGGFEMGIHKHIKNAQCVGFSEISVNALKIYKKHFPSHKNLGDVTKISETQLEGIMNKTKIDLVVAGFPCTNLTPMARFVKGDFPSDSFTEGESGLFYHLLRILYCINQINPDLHVIIENNASMSTSNAVKITHLISKVLSRPIIVNRLDNASFAVQSRKRIFWTTFDLNLPHKVTQEWKDVLDDFKRSKLKLAPVDFYNKMILPSSTQKELKVRIHAKYTQSFYFDGTGKTRFNVFYPSDTTTKKDKYYPSYPIGKSRPILSCKNYIIDRRVGASDQFLFRKLTVLEIERLFGYPEGYTNDIAETSRISVLGKSVSLFTINYVISCFKEEVK